MFAQLENALSSWLSRRHSKVEPVSLEEYSNVAVGRARRVGRMLCDRRLRRRRVLRRRRSRRVHRLELQDELRRVRALLAAVVLLLAVLALVGVADEEAVVLARVVHRLDVRGDVPLAVAGGVAGGRGRGVAGRRGRVGPRDGALAPGVVEAEGLHRPTRLRRGRVQPQRRDVDLAARRDAGQVEPDEGAEVAAVLRHDLQDRVAALVRALAALVDPGVAVRVNDDLRAAVGGRSRILHRPRVARDALVGVARRVGRTHREGVLGDRETRVRLRAGAAGDPAALVEPALVGHAALPARRERERRARVGRRVSSACRPGPCRGPCCRCPAPSRCTPPGSRRRCPPRRSRGPRTCAGRGTRRGRSS